MKIAWVTPYDATDPGSYQGRGYYAPLSLRKQSIAVDYIGPLQVSLLSRARLQLNSAKNRILHDNRFIAQNSRRWYSRDNAPFLYKEYARRLSRMMSERKDVNIVCGGVCRYSQPISYFECKQPIVVWTDTTYASAFDFYPQYFRSKISESSIRDIVANETALLNRCKLAIYASTWGAQSALDRYGIDSSRVKVVPFGANLECTWSREDIQQFVEARSKVTCKLLFVGVEWFRKGGDIAFQVAKELNRSHVPTELAVVGCDPVLDGPLPDFVKAYGHISNATADGVDRLNRLFSEAHFFIMPSRAESFGHVFCEASSFGVPSIASNVGGIPTAVRTGINGRTFSVDAGVDEYCSYILDLFQDFSRYRELALSSFHEYESRLNWTAAGRAVKQLLSDIVS